MINEALRLIRVFHDLKALELAKRINISPSYLSEIESGKKVPTLELLSRYSEEFKIPVSAILFFSEKIEGKGGHSWMQKKIAPRILKFLQEIEREGKEDLPDQ